MHSDMIIAFEEYEDNLELSDYAKSQIKKGLEDVKKGRVLSTKEALEYFKKRR